MIRLGNLGEIPSKRSSIEIHEHFQDLLEEYEELDMRKKGLPNLKIRLSIIILCALYFEEVNKKSINTIINALAESLTDKWLALFDLTKALDAKLLESIDKKAFLAYYKKQLPNSLKIELNEFADNHFDMTKVTNKNERTGLGTLLFSAINGSAPRVATVKYNGFVGISQAKKPGKASSRLKKTIFR